MSYESFNVCYLLLVISIPQLPNFWKREWTSKFLGERPVIWPLSGSYINMKSIALLLLLSPTIISTPGWSHSLAFSIRSDRLTVLLPRTSFYSFVHCYGSLPIGLVLGGLDSNIALVQRSSSSLIHSTYMSCPIPFQWRYSCHVIKKCCLRIHSLFFVP